MIKKLVVPIVLLLAACGPVNRIRTPSYVSDWPVAVQRANLAADSGDYAGAERILASYAAQYPRSRGAKEILFWRGLFKLDPGNKTGGSLTEGLALLDRYLADTSTVAYRWEASILKRLGVTTQALQAKALTPATRDTTTIVKTTTNEAEIAALKAELAKANAELERIKKRLANPNK